MLPAPALDAMAVETLTFAVGHNLGSFKCCTCDARGDVVGVES